MSALCGRRGLARVVAIALGLFGVVYVADAADSSRSTLPDWQGWWGLEGPVTVEFSRAPPPLKPELLATMRKVMTSNEGGLRDLYCRPSEFTGYSGGFVESVEFLFTPGRVTLASESGLVRRIYTDGRPLPAEVDPTSTGLSVGHWEEADARGRNDWHQPEGAVSAAFRGIAPDRS